MLLIKLKRHTNVHLCGSRGVEEELEGPTATFFTLIIFFHNQDFAGGGGGFIREGLHS